MAEFLSAVSITNEGCSDHKYATSSKCDRKECGYYKQLIFNPSVFQSFASSSK